MLKNLLGKTRTNRLEPNDWRIMRIKALHRDKHRCVNGCASMKLEVDHILPKANGGTDDLDNLQTLCEECHLKKTKTDIKQISMLKSIKKQKAVYDLLGGEI